MCSLFIEASKQRHVSFLAALPDSVRNKQPGLGKQAQKKQLGAPGHYEHFKPIYCILYTLKIAIYKLHTS